MLSKKKEATIFKAARVFAEDSRDPDTQVGCIVVSNKGHILTTGYNGPPRNVDDSKIPLTRPEKYTFMVHAEANAIYNAARNGIALEESTFFVTHSPCFKCLQAIYQVGAEEVVLLPQQHKGWSGEDEIFYNFIKNYIRIRILK